MRPTDILDHGHQVGLSLASVVHAGMMARREHDRAAAAAHREIASVEQLAAAYRAERHRANRLQAELDAMRTRALRAEAAYARRVRT